ncbi:MAG TPA: cytochrome c oxidase assembly protein [Miltoncostaeaceae bacterium]|nr:cytochrome c oxidase assembly protein [Miltoncostaeaceae bacterium]
MTILQAHLGHGPPALLAVALPAAGALAYARGVVALRRRGGRWPLHRSVIAAAGLVLLAVALAPPLAAHDGGFRAHVAQHLVLGMFAPALIALGAPVTLALRATAGAPGARPARRRLGRVLRSPVLHVLAHPVTVVLLNVGTLYALYLTPLYAATRHDAGLHALVHGHMFLAGYLLAWVLVAADPVPRRAGTVPRLAVLVAAAAGHAVLAKLMYAHGLAGDPGHALADVRAGAQLMYYGGDLAEILLALAVLQTWRGERRRAERRRERLVPAPA